jgi:hypothetical protein
MLAQCRPGTSYLAGALSTGAAAIREAEPELAGGLSQRNADIAGFSTTAASLRLTNAGK